MKKMMKTSNKINSLIRESMRIFIFPHILPDGDTTGSAYGLGSYIRSLNKDVWIITEDAIPANLNLIPKDLFFDKDEISNLNIVPDLIITLDSSDLDRIGNRRYFIDKYCNIDSCQLVNIDHHVTNEGYGHINLLDKEASSTAEMIYILLKGWGHSLSKEEALAIYTGISTDTGSFKYSNTTSKTMAVAGELMDLGIDINLINTELYQNQPLKKVKLMSLALNTLFIDFEHKYARITVTQEMLEESNATYEDTDGLVEFVRNIQGVEVVALFKQMSENNVKVSFRSKHDFDVSKIALSYNGGGHKKAAGCVLESNIENAIEKIDLEIKGGA